MHWDAPLWLLPLFFYCIFPLCLYIYLTHVPPLDNNLMLVVVWNTISTTWSSQSPENTENGTETIKYLKPMQSPRRPPVLATKLITGIFWSRRILVTTGSWQPPNAWSESKILDLVLIFQPFCNGETKRRKRMVVVSEWYQNDGQGIAGGSQP